MSVCLQDNDYALSDRLDIEAATLAAEAWRYAALDQRDRDLADLHERAHRRYSLPSTAEGKWDPGDPFKD